MPLIAGGTDGSAAILCKPLDAKLTIEGAANPAAPPMIALSAGLSNGSTAAPVKAPPAASPNFASSAGSMAPL